MIDKGEIREFLLAEIGAEQADDKLIKQLEALTIFNSQSQLDMGSFYSELEEIISWGDINSIPYFLRESPRKKSLHKIINILSWAVSSWEKGVQEANINAIVISYLLVERLYLLPAKDLSWKISFDNLKSYLKQTLPTMRFDVHHDLPRHASYSDQKFHSDYKKALEENDYKGILIFLGALDRGGGFYSPDMNFIKILSKISLAIEAQLIADNIGRYSPLLIKCIMEDMDNGQLIEVLEKYSGDSPLPLLMGLIQLMNPTGNNTVQNNLLSDYDLIHQASKLVEQISRRVETDALYSFITECSNISMNELWHAVYSAYVAENQRAAEGYINEIIFSHNTGECSYNTFERFGNESTIDDFSVKIYSAFVNHLKNLERSAHLFVFTSYYKYLFQAIVVLSDKSFAVYLEKLEAVSIELLRGLYSWELQTLHMLFTKWIFWVLASKQLKHDCEINRDALKHTYRLFQDDRVMNALKSVRGGGNGEFEKLVDFLENPESVDAIVLPNATGTVALRWDER